MTLESLVPEFIDSTSMRLSAFAYTTRYAVEEKYWVMSHLIILPELVPYSYIRMLVSTVTSVSKASDSVLFALDSDFDALVCDTVSRILLLVEYQLKVELKAEDSVTYNEKTYKTVSEKVASLKQQSKILWVATERYLKSISSRVTISNPLWEHETDSLAVKIEYMVASGLAGSTYTISSGYTIDFPSDLFDGSEISDLSTAVKVITVVWKTLPLAQSATDFNDFQTEMVSVLLVTEGRQVISISDKSIYLHIPFFNIAGEQSSKECISYSVDQDASTVSESE